MPESIVVTVGYPTEEPSEVMARRARDLTPSEGHASPIHLPPLPLGFGGASMFLDALVDEVIPEVAAHCPEISEDRTLVGWSFGGLFALYTLFHRPQCFNRYLVVSPSIWWDGRILLQYEEAWANSHRDLPARVFLAVGGQEQEPGGGWKNEAFPDEAIAAVQQVTNLKELSSRLSGRGYRSLELETVVLEGEYHLTVPAAALTRGLLWLLSEPAVEAAIT
jgi:predicted alpha/beta superfamily hydrolase